jgi:hypothetical protein
MVAALQMVIHQHLLQLPHQEPVVADVVEAVLAVTINKIKRKNEKNI